MNKVGNTIRRLPAHRREGALRAVEAPRPEKAEPRKCNSRPSWHHEGFSARRASATGTSVLPTISSRWRAFAVAIGVLTLPKRVVRPITSTFAR